MFFMKYWKKPASSSLSFLFFFNDTATTEIYTLSLHDALPISRIDLTQEPHVQTEPIGVCPQGFLEDRKSTRLNSSHDQISYAVFCLKKKKNTTSPMTYLFYCLKNDNEFSHKFCVTCECP